MRHYKNITALIESLEADAARNSNTPQYAAGVRYAAAVLRRTCIGPDRQNAKPLEECR